MGPYFHDRSVEPLEATVNLERHNRRLPVGTPKVLSRAESNDLMAFMMASTDRPEP